MLPVRDSFRSMFGPSSIFDNHRSVERGQEVAFDEPFLLLCTSIRCACYHCCWLNGLLPRGKKETNRPCLLGAQLPAFLKYLSSRKVVAFSFLLTALPGSSFPSVLHRRPVSLHARIGRAQFVARNGGRMEFSDKSCPAVRHSLDRHSNSTGTKIRGTPHANLPLI